MVQTFSPDNPIFTYLQAYDYIGFLEDEINIRSVLGYPPFKRLILLVVSAAKSRNAYDSAVALRNEFSEIASKKNIELLGPAESPLLKRGKMYRYQLLLKIPYDLKPEELEREINDFMKRSKGINLRIDVDPISFM